MDKLSVMRAFCRVVELRGFSRAASDLGVSAGLLSREIKQLEDGLGSALLIRTTRRMSLTDSGRLYYEEARRLLGEVGELEQAVAESARVVAGRLSVNAPHSFGITTLVPLVPKFLAAYPDIDLVLNLDDRVVDMVAGGFDLSIRIRTDLPDSAAVARRIGTVEQGLFAAPDYLSAHGTPQTPADLAGHPVVAFALADHGTVWHLSGPPGSASIPLSPKITVNSSLFVRDMLLAGQGIGTLPGFVADACVADGRLQPVLPDHALPPRHVFAVLASRLSGNARVRAFLGFLEAALADA